jgi:hypothetical protein
VRANVNGVPVHYAQHGSGTPVLVLHGGNVDHREIMGALEPLFENRPEYRRLYPDLPGMGRTPTPETIDSTDAVLDTLLGLVDAVLGEEVLLVVGYAGAWRLLEHYPRATFAVLDRAGHGLPHEQVGLLGASLAEWLDRVGESRRGGSRSVGP